MTGLAGHQNHQLMPHKRFGGSVADRVMLFERHPVPIVNNENSKETRTSSGNTVAGNTVPVTNNNSAPPWKNLHQEGMGKVQVRIFHIPLKGSKGRLLHSFGYKPVYFPMEIACSTGPKNYF